MVFEPHSDTAVRDDRRVRVAVVGGGITGLAAAFDLVEEFGPEAVVLLERERRTGGKIVTERVEEVVIEGGPDCFLGAKVGGLELCRRLGIEDRLQGTDLRHRQSYVRRSGRLYPLPEGLTGLVPSRLGPLVTTRILSLAGRLRAGMEYLVPRRRSTDDESIRSFAVRRFGTEAYDWLIEPLLSGIYAGDGRALGLAATFPLLAALEREHGGVLRAMMRRRRQPGGGPADRPAGFLAPSSGLAELVDALDARIPATARRTDTPVTEVDRTPEGFRVGLENGHAIRADAVVLATPAFVTADLIRDLDTELADRLREIEYASPVTVSLVYPRSAVPHPLAGYGYVSPRAEGGPVVACSWTSSKFAGRAPDGVVSVRVFLGRAGGDVMTDHDDAALVRIARDEVATTLGVTAEPRLHRLFRWPRGMPQYAVGHIAWRRDVDARVATHPGLALAGAAYRGVGIPDCVESGRAAAATVAQWLTRTHTAARAD